MFRRIITSKAFIVVGILAFLLGSFGEALVNFENEHRPVDEIPEGQSVEYHKSVETPETFPWVRQQHEVRDFFREFQKAVARDDRGTVASMMMYPLRVGYYDDPRQAGYRFLNERAELLRDYDKVFHKSVKDYV